jgi:hypothetical protein
MANGGNHAEIPFVIRHSSLFRHSDLGIRHLPPAIFISRYEL